MSSEKKQLSSRQITKKANKERREQDMVIKVFTFNIQENKLSKDKKFYLNKLARETRNYYNYLIHESQSVVDDFGNSVRPNNLFQFDTKPNTIKILFEGEYVEIELEVLSSQMKQLTCIHIQNSIKGLAALKRNGHKVGQITYKSEVNTPLSQYNSTYYLSDNARNLSLQGNKGMKFHLHRNRNLRQLCKRLKLGKVSLQTLQDLGIIELANAEIEGRKFHLTMYVNKQALIDADMFQGSHLSQLNELHAGIDAGISTEITLNIGDPFSAIEINARNPDTNKVKKLKKYQRKFNRHIAKKKKNKSKIKTGKYYDLKEKVQELNDSIVNQKIDNANKVVSVLKEFKQITFQDEMIKSWQHNSGFGYSKKIQQGILGRVYAKLRQLNKKDPHKYRKLDRSLRTTKTCICGHVNHNMGLHDRIYDCPVCGYKNDRDVHSSYIINNTKNYSGSGILPLDQGKRSKHDVVLDSNLGQVRTAVSTSEAMDWVEHKFKPTCIMITEKNLLPIGAQHPRSPVLQGGVIHLKILNNSLRSLRHSFIPIFIF